MYCLVVTNDYSRFTWVFFLANKDDTSGILKSFITRVENLVDHKVKVIRCDYGTEFKNREMNRFCEMKVSTTCYVQNRVLVVKPHNKTPHELFHGTTPTLSFMRPFGCPVTILNTIDHLEKFDGKADEGFFVGYSLNSKAFRAFNSKTRIVEENLHIRFSESTPNVVGSGPDWLFDIDALTNTMNYEQIVAGTQSNDFADPKSSHNDGSKPSSDDGNKVDEDSSRKSECNDQEKEDNVNSTNNVNNVSSIVNAAGTNEVNVVERKVSIELPFDPNMPALEDVSIFNFLNDDEDDGAMADMNNLDTTIQVSPILNTRIHKGHPLDQVIEDLHSATQTRKMSKNLEEQGFVSSIQQRTNHKDLQNCLFACLFSQEEPKKVIHALKDPSWIEAMQEELLQFKLQEVWTLVDLPNEKRAIGSKWVFENKKDERVIMIRNKARLLLKDFMVYQMDIKSAFVYGKIEEEVYVCQPPGFEDPNFPAKVYKVEKALYGLHQAPRAWFTEVKTANTPMETQKPLLKDEDDDEVDVHMYRSLIGSLMYLTSSRPDIMFEVCACARYQVNPKVSHLYAVKMIFKYLKGQPKLGLWYPQDSPFDLVAYTDSDYAEFRSTAMAKTINGEAQLHAKVDGKKIIITRSSVRRDLRLADEEGSAMPNDPHHTLTILQPTSSQPQKTQKPRKPKIKDTQVPQPSDPTNNVADEVVHKELGDRLVRAATTASSLEVEQDSDGGPRFQETMGDTIAQTRFENVSQHSNDSLLAKGNTLRSDEDRMKLDELMALCTNLQTKVLELEKTKTTQHNEIASLKKRVKKLEREIDEEILGEDASKQGRIEAIDADEEITMVNVQDDADMFDVNDLGGEEVFVTEQNENVVEEVVNVAQDKGKGIMVKEPVNPKKKDQIRLDEEAALKLQAEFDEEERLAIEKTEKQRANIALIE
nr:hypothetical protein [Tanacetum cinerariifolium]